MNDEQENSEGNYKVINITKEQLSIFKGVSNAWISAQKKFEFQANVHTKHQLSVQIEPKCFKNLIFCLTNIYGSEKVHLIKLIREMGGIIRE